MANRKRDPIARILNRKIFATRAVITWERALTSFWLPLSFTALIFVLYRWDVFGFLNDTETAIAFGVLGLGVLFGFYRSGRDFLPASRGDAIRRLDLTHAEMPITALKDKLALQADDEETQALWLLHQERMKEEAAKSKVPPANVRLSKRDPWAFRLISILALLVAAIFADPNAVHRLANGEEGFGPAGPRFEIWARPQLYTGQPTIYLNDVGSDQNVEIPINSEILVRSYAPIGELRLTETISPTGTTSFDYDGSDVQSITFVATQSGRLRVDDIDGEDLGWTITVTPDLPPEIEITGEMSRSLAGAMRLPFSARDDYGVTGGDMLIALDVARVERRYGFALEPEKRENLLAELPLPFTGDLREFEAVIEEDFATHPWAGLPVAIDLAAEDAFGNRASIETLQTEMAKKRFFDPLAAAIIDIRAQILWNRENLERADYLLRAISYRPEGVFTQQKAFLLTRSVIRRIGYLRDSQIDDDEVIEKIAEQLWQAALLIEHGDLNDAEERLKRAQDRLAEAMENGATQEEIEELMNELREATREYIRQLAQNAERREMSSNAPQSGQQMTQDQLQEMMDRIQELMEQGRMEEAQELLRQLQEMLQNMEVVQQEGQGGQGEGLQDTLRDQQDLADDTFRQLQDQFEQQQQGQEGQQDGNQSGGQQEGQQQGQRGSGTSEQGAGGQGQALSDLAERQEALREMLRNQRGGLQSDGSAEGEAAEESLGNAEESMESAEDAIRDGELGEALNQQAEALDQLRRGMRALNEQQQAQNTESEGGGQGDAFASGAPGSGDERDPLGRSLNGQDANGSALSDAQNFGVEDNRRRDFQLLKEELEGRRQNKTRPEFELDYLDRLLDRF